MCQNDALASRFSKRISSLIVKTYNKIITPTIEGKDIPVKDSAKSLNDILLEVPREQTNGIPSEMIQLLKRNGTESLGAESTQQ